ncbi:RsmB/NOP family class I SAM-dependent RNA methyltransferase [Candidatus Omnitrophota bacterium]
MDKTLHKLPKEFVERIKLIYPRQHLKILNSFLAKKTPTFRANLIKTDIPSLTAALKRRNVIFRQVGWYKNAFTLVKPSQRDFQENDLYKDGAVYFQNLSSMLPVLILGLERGMRFLDLCAAPGGKTLQAVSETRGEAEVVAVEKVKVRFYKLLANLKNQGQEELVKTQLGEGAGVFRQYPKYFDRVLVDAPCTSEANFLASNPKTYAYWSPRKIKECQHKQKRLLFSGIMSLKKGGRLVYSTCTFAPEENERVIQWALDKFKDELFLEAIRLPDSDHQGGLASWKGREFSASLRSCRRIIPTEQMEGFFLASLRKR